MASGYPANKFTQANIPFYLKMSLQINRPASSESIHFQETHFQQYSFHSKRKTKISSLLTKNIINFP